MTSRDPNRGETHVRQEPQQWCACRQHSGAGTGRISGVRRRKWTCLQAAGPAASGTPAWPVLPAEVQGTLTNLMAQLILKREDKSKTAVTTVDGHGS